VVVFTFVAAFVVFCIVQDRLTARGADRYVRLQRAAAAGAGPAVTIDQIMKPAVHNAVQQGLMWSAAVVGCGIAGAAVVARRGRRE
jgi:hypothetical protein